MSKVYAIATDAICNGQSVRDSYTVARAPYEDEESAISQIDEVVSELEDMYKSLETPDEQILVKAIDEKTKVIVKPFILFITFISFFRVFIYFTL